MTFDEWRAGFLSDEEAARSAWHELQQARMTIVQLQDEVRTTIVTVQWPGTRAGSSKS